jgi:phospholipid N-methyltransferase
MISMNGNELAEERRPSLGQRLIRSMGPAGVFLRGFVENPRMVGSVIATSQGTMDKILAPVKWDECKLFVEYGPGVGNFCKPVLDRLPRDGEMVVIDTNPLFIDYLKRTINDSRFHAVLGSAEHVEEIIRSLGHEKADYVLSGLPFSTLPPGVAPAIAAATHRVVRPGGCFITYQFSTVAKNYTARHFSRIETGLALWNIPPCYLAWGWQE